VQKLEPPLPVADIAASFQEAVTRVLVRKTLQARKELNVARIVLAGGVAANRTLRAKFQDQSDVKVYYPSHDLCTDNAAMVASAAYFCGRTVSLDASVYSRQL
jgi:N6-L-threonylcarbamoyladenine synthase